MITNDRDGRTSDSVTCPSRRRVGRGRGRAARQVRMPLVLKPRPLSPRPAAAADSESGPGPGPGRFRSPLARPEECRTPSRQGLKLVTQVATESSPRVSGPARGTLTTELPAAVTVTLNHHCQRPVARRPGFQMMFKIRVTFNSSLSTARTRDKPATAGPLQSAPLQNKIC